jgi:PAS domain S-box-containing protein
MSASEKIHLTGVERTFPADQFLVSKTDTKGRVTYANRVFLDIAGYKEHELVGQPHSVIRHPDMPRCVFKFMWDTIMGGDEIFAYVVNRAMNGDHYWVFAHVTPSFDTGGTINGYHSNRRIPNRKVVEEVITPLYKALRTEEQKHTSRKDGMMKSYQMLLDVIKEKGMSYEELIFALSDSDA